MKTIDTWVQDCHELAVEKGWWSEPEDTVLTKLLLIHSEVSEAVEAYREGSETGFREELADVAIRLFDLWGAGLEGSFEAVIQHKHEVNKDRLYRHGGKRA